MTLIQQRQRQRQRQRRQTGFTLIELMVVVAIIGILAAVAIPQYQNYTRKTRIGVALNAVDSLKTAVALCAQENGGVLGTCDSGTANIPAFTPTREVAAATVTDGVVVATLGTAMGNGIDGQTITWTPVPGASNLTWTVTTNITDAVLLDQLRRNNL